MAPTPYCTNRLFEWAMTTAMTLIGAGMLLAPLAGIEIIGAVLVFQLWGLSLFAAAWAFFLVGAGRAFALYANGRWWFGPYIRAVGCGIGAWIWGQMTASLVGMIFEKHQMFIVVFVWLTITIFEVISLIRSLLDLRVYHARVSENAARNP